MNDGFERQQASERQRDADIAEWVREIRRRGKSADEAETCFWCDAVMRLSSGGKRICPCCD